MQSNVCAVGHNVHIAPECSYLAENSLCNIMTLACW